MAAARLVTGTSTAPLSLVNVALGGWLIASPFVLGYNEGADAPTATWNDIIVGIVIIGAALMSWLIGSIQRSDQKRT